MDTNVVVCLLIGLPGVGKTTLANKIVAHTKSSASKTTLRALKFSFDEHLPVNEQEKLVLESQNNGNSKAFKIARENFVTVVSNVIQNIQSRSNENKYLKIFDLQGESKYVLIVDDNFYYKSMRYKFYQEAAKFNCGFCQVYLKCSQDFAAERNENRPSKVSPEVIEVMHSRIEPPSLSNGWETQSIYVNVHQADLPFSDILNLIESNFKNGLSPISDNSEERKNAQLLNLSSLAHRADLILRPLVGETINIMKEKNDRQNTESLNLKKLSIHINSVRQSILTEIKNQTILVPSEIFEMDVIKEDKLGEFVKDLFNNRINNSHIQ